jgi:DNA-binding NarL/FixJ family response regulator
MKLLLQFTKNLVLMLCNAINLAILDDHLLFTRILKNFITEQKNMNVVIQCSNLQDLLKKLTDYQVHVLLMELFLPHPSGAEAVKIVKNKFPHVKILILTRCTDMSLLNDLLEAGIYGIVSKNDEPEELINAISSLSEEKLYRNKIFTEVLYWSKQKNIILQPDTEHIRLDNRENEILQMLWQEKSNREIANHLYLSVRSVEKIRQNLKEKLGVKSTIGLLKFGIDKKIIKVNPLLQQSFA